jgi:hypothetical protein
MIFPAGTEVEVKLGGSLGRWVPGEVVSGAMHGRTARYVVTVNGRTSDGVSGRDVRRARAEAQPPPRAAPKARRPKAARARNEREPLRFDEYRRWVKAQRCMFCALPADDPHHYGPKGMGQTTDDTRIVPVCRRCHDDLHARRLPVSTDSWGQLEASIYRKQVDLLTEFLRVHGELR